MDLDKLLLNEKVTFGNRFEVGEGLAMQLSGQIILDSMEVLTTDIIQTNKRRLALTDALYCGRYSIYIQ